MVHLYLEYCAVEFHEDGNTMIQTLSRKRTKILSHLCCFWSIKGNIYEASTFHGPGGVRFGEISLKYRSIRFNALYFLSYLFCFDSSLPGGEIRRWQNSKDAKFQGSKIRRWQNSKVTKFEDDEIRRWRNSKVAKLEDGEIRRMRNSKVTKFEGGKI